MRKKLLNILIILMIVFCFSFVACEFSNKDKQKETYYTVTWLNYDGTILEKDNNVEYGTKASYDGETPEREEDETYTYEFDGWDKEIAEVKADTIYTAKFKATEKKVAPITYTVTWKNYDGKVLEIDNNVEYGTKASYDGEIPEREEDEKYTYEFDGWDKEIAEVKADTIYTAKFKSTEKPIITDTFTVVWKNYNGKVLEIDENIKYWALASYDGEIPEREEDESYTYEFDGWDKEPGRVKKSTIYIASFKASKKQIEPIEKCKFHDWSNQDGVCAKCGTLCEAHFEFDNSYQALNEDCIFSQETHRCKICGYKCNHTIEIGGDYLRAFVEDHCLLCGVKVCEEHDWSNHDGKCAECGIQCKCFKVSKDGYYVDEGGEPVYISGEIYWRNHDGICKVCGRKCSHYDDEIEETLIDKEYSFECKHCAFYCEVNNGCHDYSNGNGICKTCGYKCDHGGDYLHARGKDYHCSECGVDFSPKLIIEPYGITFDPLNLEVKFLVKQIDKLNVWGNGEVLLFVWTNGDGDYNINNSDCKKLSAGTSFFDDDDNVCIPFTYTNLECINLGDYIYAKAIYIEKNYDQVVIYRFDSEVLKFSVLSYVQDVKGQDAELDEILENMLIYGAKAQEEFNYKKDDLVTDEHFKLTLKNCYLDYDGSKGGYFKKESFIVITNNYNKLAKWTVNGVEREGISSVFYLEINENTVIESETVEYVTITFNTEGGYVLYNGEKVTSVEIGVNSYIRVNGNSITIGNKVFYAVPNNSDYEFLIWNIDNGIVEHDLEISAIFRIVGTREICIKTEDILKGKIQHELELEEQFIENIFYKDIIDIEGDTILVYGWVYKAIPEVGYVFDHWEYKDIQVTEDASITAIFKIEE